MSIRSFLRSVRTLGKGVAVGVSEADERSDPIDLFREWLAAAKETGLIEPTSMTLATSTPDGRPSARTVLLKQVDARGFVFFTNYESRKAADLNANARAALVFYWPPLLRQVMVNGSVQRISREESEAYFKTRARGSQLGAWASQQSRVLTSREELLERYQKFKEEYEGREIDLPSFWGGYRLAPSRIEFWQARPNRLHDRVLFERSGGGWVVSRLYP